MTTPTEIAAQLTANQAAFLRTPTATALFGERTRVLFSGPTRKMARKLHALGLVTEPYTYADSCGVTDLGMQVVSILEKQS